MAATQPPAVRSCMPPQVLQAGCTHYPGPAHPHNSSCCRSQVQASPSTQHDLHGFIVDNQQHAFCTSASSSERHSPRLPRLRLRPWEVPPPPPSLRTALVLPPPRLPLPVAPPAEPLACLLPPPLCRPLGRSRGFQAPRPRNCSSDQADGCEAASTTHETPGQSA